MCKERNTTTPETYTRVTFQYYFAYFPPSNSIIFSHCHMNLPFIAPPPIIILHISFHQYLPSYEIPQKMIKVRNATVTRQL